MTAHFTTTLARHRCHKVTSLMQPVPLASSLHQYHKNQTTYPRGIQPPAATGRTVHRTSYGLQLSQSTGRQLQHNTNNHSCVTLGIAISLAWVWGRWGLHGLAVSDFRHRVMAVAIIMGAGWW